uniref:Vitamin D3 hydroxylase-associated protein-like n=1 Tax=Pogona vitticeps TaxID=103695 RepID=A0A6J0UV61_9SAUR
MLQDVLIMMPEWMKQPWSYIKMDLRVIFALACSSSAAFLALKWMGRERIKRQIKEARSKRDHGLGQMEKAVQRFKLENPGTQSACILSLPLAELAEKLKEESLSPETVLYTYMEKALIVTQETNCVRDFIPECEHQLQEIKKQKAKGLLHGIPISIKDHIGYKGHLSTCGLAHFLGVLQEEDSVLVKVLKRQGAIPFVLTNVPQSLFNYDCSNSIFGQTMNPLDHKRGPGGSSGGEGALIAGGGSILGFGSDIGGSIRIPSSFCGICGLKPTAGRLSNSGVKGPIDGILSVAGTVGPMARDVDSLAFCMKALLCEDMFQMDPTVPPMPFNEEVYAGSAPLQIGYYDTDGYFLLPPCMRRAVHKTAMLLQEAGHRLIPFTPPSVDYAMDELFLKGIFADGGSFLLTMFEKDIVDPRLKPQVTWLRIQKTVKRVLAKIVKPWFPRLASHLNALCGVRSVKNLWEHHEKVMAYHQKFIDEWRKCQLDVLLCPVLGPAFLLGYPAKILPAVSCTMLYNVLNFPAGTVPVTTVTEADEEELRCYRGLCGDPWDKKLQEAVEGAVGLPVAVQCVALPWQEELCLRFMKEVEKLSQEVRQK